MRKKLIAGNWKMNKTPTEAEKLAVQIKAGLLDKFASNGSERYSNIDICIAPPFLSIERVGSVLAGNKTIALCAQSCAWEDSGAYTGEISPSMLKEAGVGYVIIGHSERRAHFNESDETVFLRARAAVRNGLIPIVCIGESLSAREKNQTNAVLQRQIASLRGLSEAELRKLIIAYEPIWAIGTGKSASESVAEDAAAFIREQVGLLFCSVNLDGGEKHMRILYGGSMNKSNAALFLACKNIDGGLVGGAALSAEEFIGIIAKAAGDC